MPQMYFQLFACECVCMCGGAGEFLKLRVCVWVRTICVFVCVFWSIWYNIRSCVAVREHESLFAFVCVYMYALAYLYETHKKNYTLSVYWMGKQNGMPNKILWTHISFVMHGTHHAHFIYVHAFPHVFFIYRTRRCQDIIQIHFGSRSTAKLCNITVWCMRNLVYVCAIKRWHSGIILSFSPSTLTSRWL